MKKFIYLLFGMFLFSCSTNDPISKGNHHIEILTEGKWVVSEFDGEKNKLGNGVVFSKDKQLFNTDSQGRIIPTHHKQIFDLINDTLRIVDYKYEQSFIEEKGTLIFKVEDLNDKSLKLISIYPDTLGIYKFRKEEL